MARFILRPKTQINKSSKLETQQIHRSVRHSSYITDPAQIALILRKPRSQEYMKVMQKLDAGGVQLNSNLVKEISDIITKEFPQVDIPKILMGIIGHCYLGEPYEVHTLDLSENEVIKHYKVGETLPNGLEKARPLANAEGYEFIEVYWDACRAISKDGSVAVIHV